MSYPDYYENVEIYKDLIQTVLTLVLLFFLEILKKRKKKNLKMKKKKVNWSFSELFYFFFVHPTLNLKNDSRK